MYLHEIPILRIYTLIKINYEVAGKILMEWNSDTWEFAIGLGVTFERRNNDSFIASPKFLLTEE